MFRHKSHGVLSGVKTMALLDKAKIRREGQHSDVAMCTLIKMWFAELAKENRM